jgi:hypothetical protein
MLVAVRKTSFLDTISASSTQKTPSNKKNALRHKGFVPSGNRTDFKNKKDRTRSQQCDDRKQGVICIASAFCSRPLNANRTTSSYDRTKAIRFTMGLKQER